LRRQDGGVTFALICEQRHVADPSQIAHARTAPQRHQRPLLSVGGDAILELDEHFARNIVKLLVGRLNERQRTF
jgi:hypothetical protein